jgi:hypothetical protein
MFVRTSSGGPILPSRARSDESVVYCCAERFKIGQDLVMASYESLGIAAPLKEYQPISFHSFNAKSKNEK